MSADFTVMHELYLSDSAASMEGFDFPKAKSLTENVSEEEQEKRKRHAAINISKNLSRCPHPACGEFLNESSVLSHVISEHRVGERYKLFELFESKRIALSASLKTLLHSTKRNIVIGSFVYAGPNELPEFCPASRGICLENNFLRPDFNHYKSHLPMFVLGRFTTFAKCLNVPIESDEKPDTLILWCVTVETTKPMFCYITVYDSEQKRIAAALTGVRKMRKSQNPNKFFKKSTNYLRLSKGHLERMDDNFFLTVTVVEYEDTSAYDEESGLEDEDPNDVSYTDLVESDEKEIKSPMAEKLKKAKISKEPKSSGIEISDLVPAKTYSANTMTYSELEDKKKNMKWVKGKSETSGNTSTDTCSIETPLLLSSDDQNSYTVQQLNTCLQSIGTVPKMNALAGSVSSEETISSKGTPSDTSSINTLTFETSDDESVYRQRFIDCLSSANDVVTVPKTKDALADAVSSEDTMSSTGSSFDTSSLKTTISEISKELSSDN